MKSRTIRTAFAAAILIISSLVWRAPLLAQDFANDYPTAARAEYVFGCMEANGGTPDSLRRCACSIDVIASILPYDQYVAAETVMSVVQVGGVKASIFRTPSVGEKVAELRRAQAEGEIRCF